MISHLTTRSFDIHCPAVSGFALSAEPEESGIGNRQIANPLAKQGDLIERPRCGIGNQVSEAGIKQAEPAAAEVLRLLGASMSKI